jgi:hypothetical protein
MLLVSGGLSAQLDVELDSQSGRVGSISWDGFWLVRHDTATGSSTVEFGFDQLRGLPGLSAGTVSILCADFSWTPAGLRCREGQLRLPDGWLALEGGIGVSLEPTAVGRYRLMIDHPQLQATVDWSDDEGVRLTLDRMDSKILQPLLAGQAGVSSLGGQAAGQISLDNQGLTLDLAFQNHSFDTQDGLAAGDGLDFELSVAGRAEEDRYQLSFCQTAGELLLGPVYLPPPASPVCLETGLSLIESSRLDLTSLSFTDPGSLSMVGNASFEADENGWQFSRLALDAFELDLGGFWPRWLDGPFAAAGFPGLKATGLVHGSLSWRREGGSEVDIKARSLGVQDPRGRVGVQALDAALQGSDGQARLDLSWDSLELLEMVLGASQAKLVIDEVGLRLLEPVRMALLDGAIVVDGLAWLDLQGLESKLVLDARIEPVDLASLTGSLGLPELGGELSGRFPGVTFSDQRLAFTGGIEIDAFSGRIGVEELVVERLFGTAPALAAQVELERLDLLELTGAFGFGRMEGQASGRVRNLRLLDWRPVAMDARLYTHLDSPRRRISQRAVDNLSSLGGGGSAVISGTVLRIFEDFPYKQAGLACRLDNNICQIDGIGPHESGGFLIVEGRGLPRLDVVGHRRLVDWPRLTRQLLGMMEAESAEAAESHGGSGPGPVE